MHMAPTILLVDDSPTDQRCVMKALDGRGYRFVVAVDGEDALAKVAAEKPGLVILDVVMPKKNGFQVCRQIKSLPETRNVKIMMLSSKSLPSDEFWGLKQGADCYLTKPFSDTKLAEKVAQMLA
jgi:twitching motility two-component system response regulator PilH